MKRGKPMKRTAFRRIRAEGPTAAKEQRPWASILATSTLRPTVGGSYSGGTTGEVVEKENALQHQGYMNAVRDLGYCMRCKRVCRPQFAHADEGKGTGIKTDVRRGWPGCGPGDWGPGCHYVIGTSGEYGKAERRVIEERLGRLTRSAVIAAGTWPARLPMWTQPERNAA